MRTDPTEDHAIFLHLAQFFNRPAIALENRTKWFTRKKTGEALPRRSEKNAARRSVSV